MALKHYGVVDSEGGLLVFGDAATLQLWRGSDHEQAQSTQIESIFEEGLPGMNVPIFQKTGVLWNLFGPGTADIFQDESLDKLIIVRCWLDESDDIDEVMLLGQALINSGSTFAEFEISTGMLVIMDSIESGNCIESGEGFKYSLSEDEMMTETSGMLLPILNGRYQCFHDEVQTELREARRCHIIRVTNL